MIIRIVTIAPYLLIKKKYIRHAPAKLQEDLTAMTLIQ